MKNLLFAAFTGICFVVSLNAQEVVYKHTPSTLIGKELQKNKVVHSIDLYHIEELKGVKKGKSLFEAVIYSPTNSTTIYKGMKVSIVNENKVHGYGSVKPFDQMEVYVDENEYPELLVAINQIFNQLYTKEAKKQLSSMHYSTADGLTIGYLVNEKKNVGFIGISQESAKIMCEYSNARDMLLDLKNILDILQKELYKPENLEKMKNAKKSKQKAKDVNIDDI